MNTSTFEELCINTIRFLAVDMVQKANSGHPGTPMGPASMAYVLWDRFLKHNPSDPKWLDREYRNEVLPPNIRARISIEAASPVGWERYVGLDGGTISLPRFGASAPGKVLYEKLGLTTQHVIDEVLRLL